MKCESCKTASVEIEYSKKEGLEGGIWNTGEPSKPYYLCFECKNRLENLALRPRELFNLVAIHGHCGYLHDDFYDYDTGEATQPEIDVVDSEKYPFPIFDEIKSNLDTLIDFAFVQYFTTDTVFEQLRKFDRADVLSRVAQKVQYNDSISDKAYEIVSNVVGREAERWARVQWEGYEGEEKALRFSELVANCLPFEEGFDLITQEIGKSEDRAFNDNISALLYFKNEKTLDWIESNVAKIKSTTSSFGQLAASSQFSWRRCEKWLVMGRPLSLIALDALYLCTTNSYANQSLWLRKLKPKLVGEVIPEIIIERLQLYLSVDSVPRTKNVIGNIVHNLTAVG